MDGADEEKVEQVRQMIRQQRDRLSVRLLYSQRAKDKVGEFEKKVAHGSC
ncbi:MAG: hypothetical protein ACLRYY_11710 [Anaerobutyricum soehngenii]